MPVAEHLERQRTNDPGTCVFARQGEDNAFRLHRVARREIQPSANELVSELSQGPTYTVRLDHLVSKLEGALSRPLAAASASAPNPAVRAAEHSA
jgi:hypothetical protein